MKSGKVSIGINWWEIENDFYEYEISISNNLTMTTITIYGTPDSFKEISKKMMSFPENINEKIEFICGSDEREADDYFNLSIYCYLKNGYSAIKVISDNKEEEPNRLRNEFSILTLPYCINQFGSKLYNWNPYTDGDFEWEFEN
jgi:hypothetical protein